MFFYTYGKLKTLRFSINSHVASQSHPRSKNSDLSMNLVNLNSSKALCIVKSRKSHIILRINYLNKCESEINLRKIGNK